MLIDMGHFLHRANFAYGKLALEDGTPVGMIYGTISMLLTLNKNYYPDELVLVYDGGSDRRRAVFPEYKSQRKTKHNGFHQQYLIVRTILSDLGLKSCLLDGEEADDVIASLAVQDKGASDIIIVSGDHDFLQLVSHKVKVLKDGANSKLYDERMVEEEYGVTPSKVLGISVLMGDIADNIPGILGVGIKKASSWIKEYGSIDNLIEKEIAVKEYSELLKRNIDLMSLKTDLSPIPTSSPKSLNVVRSLFKNYFRFESLLKRWDEVELLANGGVLKVRSRLVPLF